jgi:Glycosyl transferase family 2
MGLPEFRDRHLRALRATKRRIVEFGVQPWLLRGRVKHLYGPADVTYGSEEVLLITVVRNGALYVKSFMEHYLGLGVAHCVFLDNGSTDGTVDMLREYPRVTMLQTDAPYGRFENTMKRYLAERFSNGRWNLCADIDELFDYPLSDRVPLAGFLRYLNTRGFSAAVAQMLDMFAPVPLADLRSTVDDRLKEKYTHYDISAIDAPPYEWSQASSPDVRMHWGGIRRAIFGTGNGLTKAALVLMNGRVRPFVNWHHVTGAVVADVSCVLFHYPFLGTFAEKVQEAARTRRYGATTSDEYAAYAEALARNPRLSLMLPSARRFTRLESLIADTFLVVSEEYRRYVRSLEFPRGRDAGSSCVIAASEAEARIKFV